MPMASLTEHQLASALLLRLLSSSSSAYLISSMSPAASWILCQALHCPHWTKTSPLSHAIGLTILLVVPSALRVRLSSTLTI